jgi:hypothetical protein
MVVPLHGVKLVATMKQPCGSGTLPKRRDLAVVVRVKSSWFTVEASATIDHLFRLFE